jgi:hypothetical protein
VVDVDHDRQIDGRVWQVGLGLGAEHHLDVRDLLAIDLLLQQREHLGLDIGGVDTSR